MWGEPVAGGLRAAVASLGEIDLPTLLAAASLQTRVDRKYLVPTSTAAELVRSQAATLVALDIEGRRESRYESVYFDTPGLACYLAAAHGRRRRLKVRTRTYLDSAASVLEVKRISARGETIKDRLAYPFHSRTAIDHGGREFLVGLAVPPTLVDALRVELVTGYLRTTLLEDSGARVTLDVELVCTATDGSRCAIKDLVVVETKSGGRPTGMDRALWARGFRPEPISKYCTGLAAVRPGIPANKWNRTLRRHFDWTPAHAVRA